MSKILYCKLQRARQLRDYEMQKVAERVTAMAQADRPTMTGRGGQGVQVAAVHFSEPLSRRFYVYDPERSLVEPVGYAIYTREEWAAVCSLPSDEIKREDWVDVLFSMATLQVYDMAACGDQLRIMMEDTHERELDKSIRREPVSLAPRLCTTPFRQVYTLPSPVPFLRFPHTTPSTHQRLSQVGFKPERPARTSGPIPTLAGLPTEIQEMILDLLDLLDGTCLGLANRHFYKVHRRCHGSVPLSTARDGPNDLEWAWRAAGDLLRRPPGPGELTSQAAAEGGDEGSRSATRTRRRFWCEMCGFSRCELQRHLSGWVPPGHEYCSVSRKFGPPAAGGMESHCHRRSPKHHGLCGRHHCKASSRVTIPGRPIARATCTESLPAKLLGS
ncbi:hypothetical protein EsH8_IV_000282 [Colletotrichum jinshuiense]